MMTADYRRRLQCLQSVDELVATVVDALRATGELENTYLVYTSDNGFHFGQHRMLQGKGTAYEEDIRVPFAIRGPGVAKGRTIEALALITDLAPTFAAWAGAETPDFVDGRSFVPLLEDPDLPWRRSFLVQHEGIETDPRLTMEGALALRTARYAFVAYDGGQRELYDLTSDPYQLRNMVKGADDTLVETLVARLTQLRACRGQECRDIEDMPIE